RRWRGRRRAPADRRRSRVDCRSRVRAHGRQRRGARGRFQRASPSVARGAGRRDPAARASARQARGFLMGFLSGIADRFRQGLEREARPSVVLMLGVNGSGKTTSTGKLAAALRQSWKGVLLAAADTFRAAAVEQLEEWGRRSGTEVIRQGPGADPAAVVFDAV